MRWTRHLHHIYRHHQVENQEGVMNINHQVAELQASRQDQVVTRLRDLLDQVFRQNHSQLSHDEQLHFCEGPPRHSRAPQPTCLDKAPRLSISYLDLGI